MSDFNKQYIILTAKRIKCLKNITGPVTSPVELSLLDVLELVESGFDVYEVNPNIVVYDLEGNVDGLKDRDLITLLIIESQYKDQQIQSLQSEIELLKQRLDNLES
jgi:hypothetical protein